MTEPTSVFERWQELYHNQPDLATCDHQTKLEFYTQIAELGKIFNYEWLKNLHIDSCKEYGGTLTTNFAEPTQLNQDDQQVQQAREFMLKRFRGYYPVVVDIETTGVDYTKHSIIQIAAQALTFNQDLELVPYAELRINIHPLPENELVPESLAITGINPFDPTRKAVSLKDALTALCKFARGAQKAHGCKRCVMVAHNVNFDKGFLYHYMEQSKTKRVPFHPFTSFDTSVLGAVFVGETRLKVALSKLGFSFDDEQAHDALYDTKQCSKLFCYCINQSKDLAMPYLSGDDED